MAETKWGRAPVRVTFQVTSAELFFWRRWPGLEAPRKIWQCLGELKHSQLPQEPRTGQRTLVNFPESHSNWLLNWRGKAEVGRERFEVCLLLSKEPQPHPPTSDKLSFFACEPVAGRDLGVVCSSHWCWLQRSDPHPLCLAQRSAARRIQHDVHQFPGRSGYALSYQGRRCEICV